MPTTSHPQKVSLLELATYQPDAIVSRQIVKTETGSVTFFAFDAGQELSEHSAPFDALVHVLEGQVEIRISGQPYLLQAGEAILMPAGQPHAVRAIQPFKMVLTMLRAEMSS
ncbi:MAG: cupin domain-containing protein [Anaerolineae bacterium]|nr:MAG: cupin domain-containing protein [Anaerolineae bacterium]